MKTTVTLEEDLSTDLAKAAEAAGQDMNSLVNNLVRLALKSDSAFQSIPQRPFKQRTYDLGWYPQMTSEKIREISSENSDDA